MPGPDQVRTEIAQGQTRHRFLVPEQTSNNIFKVKLEASAVMWCCRNGGEGRKDGWRHAVLKAAGGPEREGSFDASAAQKYVNYFDLNVLCFNQ